MKKRTDAELMSMVLKKNTRAFKILYNRYEPGIYNFILRYTGSREIAQDLLQETFTRIWFAAHLFDHTRGGFKGWLYTIAMNITRNEMSKKRYDTHFFDVSEMIGDNEPAHSQTERPDFRAEHSDLKTVIAKALGNLKPDLREIIILKHYQQLTFREIAEITQTPEGTLKARFYKAIAQLKEILEPIEM